MAFSLLPTDGVVPMTYNGSKISWYHSFIVDRQVHRAYLYGYGVDSHELFVLAVDYDAERAGTGPRRAGTGPAPTEFATLTLYHTESVAHVVYDRPVLTADGDLLLVGGTELNRDGTVDNFTPHATALLLRVGEGQQAKGDFWLWLGGIALVLVVLVVGYKAYLAYKSNRSHEPHEPHESHESYQPAEPADFLTPSLDLMGQIDRLMEREELFRRSGLKLQDVAELLNTNRTYVTDCIKAARGMSFSQYVNAYRVNYAKEQLIEQPDKKISAIATDAGFSTEVSFFRAFKALTGTTPSEYRAQKD